MHARSSSVSSVVEHPCACMGGDGAFAKLVVDLKYARTIVSGVNVKIVADLKFVPTHVANFIVENAAAVESSFDKQMLCSVDNKMLNCSCNFCVRSP